MSDITDKFKINTAKVIEKVYHTEELHKILQDVIVDFVNQVVLMSDDELHYDRDDWMKRFGRDIDRQYEIDNNYIYESDIHSLAIFVEQLRRFGEIQYGRQRKLEENKLPKRTDVG